MLATEIIKNKRNKQSLSETEIQFFVQSYTKGVIPDYQMSALLMAIFLNGMTQRETIQLTQTMLDSGEKIRFDGLQPVDKHSTGGVGDKTSLILAPIVAACGVPVPMMSGRGLGHTGGTLDKLESIPGFNVNLSLETFKKQVIDDGLCFIGQTEDICPADKKIYSLRDVTGTVESLPLICASIMSKKIAEGISGLVLDVKFGSGAFMKSQEAARELADSLIAIGQGHGLTVNALLTNMDQPLGRFVGNGLEVRECLSLLKQNDLMGWSYKDFADTESLSLELASQMIAIGKNIPVERAMEEAKEALHSGRAFEAFERACINQGGSIDKMGFTDRVKPVKAQESGYLRSLDSEKIGIAGIELGAGRRIFTDKVDPLPGIEVHKKLGDYVEKNDLLFSIHHTAQTAGLDSACTYLKNCFTLSQNPAPLEPLIAERI